MSITGFADPIWLNGILPQDAPTLLSGITGAVCLTVAPMFRTRKMILLIQLAAGLSFAAHYAFLGITVATVANILGAVQTVAALLSSRNAAMGRLGYALIALGTLLGLWFWQGPISALSLIAMTLVALARMQQNDLYLRVLLLVGGAFWTLHDFAGEAWIAFAADVGAVLTGAVALLATFVRVRIEWRPPINAPLSLAA
jgi:hypothetical protein